jgi:hypothetical protein
MNLRFHFVIDICASMPGVSKKTQENLWIRFSRTRKFLISDYICNKTRVKISGNKNKEFLTNRDDYKLIYYNDQNKTKHRKVFIFQLIFSIICNVHNQHKMQFIEQSFICFFFQVRMRASKLVYLWKDKYWTLMSSKEKKSEI